MVTRTRRPRRRDAARRSLRAAALLVPVLLAAGCRDVVEPGLRPSSPEPAPVRRDLLNNAVLDRAHWADGYLWAYDPTIGLYNLNSSFYSFHRTGGAITIRKPAGTTGRYIAKFAGLSGFLGSKSTVHVTGYGSDVNDCKPVGATLKADSVEIRCSNAATDAATNAYFSLLVTRNYANVAFAHAQQPTGTNYAPQGNASWNPVGSIRVFRSGVGSYSVQFNNLGSYLSGNGGHFQVNAVGTDKKYCKIGGWGGSPNLTVSVRCFVASGNPGDTKFNVLFVLPSDHLAYVWADQPSSGGYTPSIYYSSNPSGGAISITRSGVGQYVVTWSNAGVFFLDGGDVQVSAYGGGNAQCKVAGWGSQSASVRCFSPNGALVDSYFTALLGS